MLSSSLYVNHVKKFVENINVENLNIGFLGVDETKKGDNHIAEEGCNEGEKQKNKEKKNTRTEDKMKVEEVRTKVSANCRIVKIKEEYVDISKWNLIKGEKINDNIINALIKKFNFKTFLPCQSSILEYSLLNKNGSNSLLSGDIYIEVPTGLGKTLSYIIAILDYFLYKKEDSFFCLILTATEELVTQILDVIKKFNIPKLKCDRIDISKFNTKIYFDDIINNDNIFKSINILASTASKFEILFYNNENLFKNLKFLVLDEVDKILSSASCNINNLVNCLTTIVENHQNSDKNLYKTRYYLQKIFSSATLCKASDKLMSLNLYRPIFFYYIPKYQRLSLHVICQEASEHAAWMGKGNVVCPCVHASSPLRSPAAAPLFSPLRLPRPPWLPCSYVLPHFLIPPFSHFHTTFVLSPVSPENLSMIIFCNQEDTTHILFRYLTVYFSYTKDVNCSIGKYYRSLSSVKRKKILKNFLGQKINILLCTDNISRGLDTVNVNYIVNYDMPTNYNVLTHRIGRLSRYCAPRPPPQGTCAEAHVQQCEGNKRASRSAKIIPRALAP
ncbi:ATP-dependent RNA helicase, putative [Plasmodium ovale wallikeri]|uniref:ATP-dependent RNA helicase n=1 Tax=Plasmodium ovale wallikeri TaxID=864142 RepID=A0A1A8YHL8_PLAOA|nr:ATP-dependent RNA helicase, putative [Plasmodium ovale wallikeri]SBT37461.1 ATP-dependent RNA helicase, putative [Plasmodium ovale wallikeri]